jgi:hypothetical protein
MNWKSVNNFCCYERPPYSLVRFDAKSLRFVIRKFYSTKRIILEPLSWWRMTSSGMLRRVALERTNVSEKLTASFIRVTTIGELWTTLAVTIFLRSVRRLLVTASVVPSSPIIVTLMKEALSSSETSVLTRATKRNIPEDDFLHSHRRENFKSPSWCPNRP